MADIGCQNIFYENVTLGVVRVLGTLVLLSKRNISVVMNALFVSRGDRRHYVTLGVVRVLEAIGGVSNVAIAKSGPVERGILSSWEQRYGVLLPTDLRRFYLAVDGFSLTWDFEYGGRLLPGVGRMHVNPISDVRRLSGMGADGADSTPPPLPLPPPLPACSSHGDSEDHVNILPVKAFELDSCRGAAKICLVATGGVWLLDRAFEWHPLARDFTCYFRIMLVHLGLPLWQFRFTPMGLTPWAEQLASLVAPHLLQNTPMMTNPMTTEGVPTYSQLDPAVFKTTSRSRTRKKEE